MSRISGTRKKRRGRPPTGQDPVIALRLPKDEIARLDKWAKAQGLTRSEAVRKAISYLVR
jgi:predicted DNA-binding protein